MIATPPHHTGALPRGKRHVPWRFGRGMLLYLLLTTTGCATVKELNAIKATAAEMSQDIGALQLRLSGKIDTGGGDVNEPVTGWILAIGYSLVPVSFLGYLLAHRSQRFRDLKKRIRGEGATREPC